MKTSLSKVELEGSLLNVAFHLFALIVVCFFNIVIHTKYKLHSDTSVMTKFN